MLPAIRIDRRAWIIDLESRQFHEAFSGKGSFAVMTLAASTSATFNLAKSEARSSRTSTSTVSTTPMRVALKAGRSNSILIRTWTAL
jgi:hypothetical protein